MMHIFWTRLASQDVGRLHDFLKIVNPAAATKTVQQLLKAPHVLLENPRIGERLDEFEPREIRRLVVARYEVRYEVKESVIHILRIWHTREDR